MKLALTGAKGQLGQAVLRLCEQRGIAVAAVDLPELDISDCAQVQRFVEDTKPQALLHCAAYTAVEQAEDDAARCFAVNEQGTVHTARACERMGAQFLYVSTDYVFGGSGTQQQEVDDPKAPLNVYGASKLAGERAALECCSKACIVRTSWLYGEGGNHFVGSILKKAEQQEEIPVVADQVGSPTYTRDLAELLLTLAQHGTCGVFHATNEGFCSWEEFAREVLRLSASHAYTLPVAAANYPTRAKRPANSRLSKASLDEAGLSRLPAWQDALGRYLQNLQQT